MTPLVVVHSEHSQTSVGYNIKYRIGAPACGDFAMKYC